MYDSIHHSIRAVVLAASALALAGQALRAQQPASAPPSPPQAPTVTPYRPPVIALARPLSGGSVPMDRPVVVFRFAQGELADPIDARSLSVAVDGHDCTAGFQMVANEAWGRLCNPAMGANAPPDPGAHVVVARVCSARGTCAEVASTIMVTGAAASGRDPTPGSNRGRVLDLLLQAARKLLNP